MRMGAERFNYITDALGSVVALTNESGSVAARYDYAPYGELIESSGTVDNPWRFASGYFDEETDLYKFGTRYYDPSLGRWTQQDPVKGKLGNPITMNPYQYAQCDPINVTDPSGRFSIFEGIAATLATLVGCATGAAAFGTIGFVTGAYFGGVAARDYNRRRRRMFCRRYLRRQPNSRLMNEPSKSHCGRSALSQQPKLVRVAQTVVIPLGFVFFSLLGVWWYLHDNKDGAVVAFVLAGSGPVSIALYYVLYHAGVRGARRRAFRESISLKVDGPTALHWVTEVLRDFAPNADPEVDFEHFRISLTSPRTWKTAGERVTAVIQPGQNDSTVEVTSFCVGPQIMDYGKNRANVEAIIQALVSFDKHPPSQ